MAYTNEMNRLTVRGAFENGEVWTNTWAFVGTGALQDAVDDFHTFYASVFGGDISSHTTAVGAVNRRLGDGLVTEMDWSTITGDDLADLLPTSSAIRVSLSAGIGHRGGPFISGWSVNAVDANGNLLTAEQTNIADALESLRVDLIGHDYLLGLDSPQDELVREVTQGRVGLRFDVIRKRTNDLAESYAVVPFP